MGHRRRGGEEQKARIVADRFMPGESRKKFDLHPIGVGPASLGLCGKWAARFQRTGVLVMTIEIFIMLISLVLMGGGLAALAFTRS